MKASDYELIMSCIKFGAPATESKLVEALNQEIILANERRQELLNTEKANKTNKTEKSDKKEDK